MKQMTRWLMVLFLMASLGAFAACESDEGSDDSDTTAAADTTGGADTTADTAGGEETAEETAAAGGKCENEADLAILADENVDANNTSKDCLLGPCGPDEACIADCLANGNEAKEIAATNLSGDCAACFSASTICGYNNCLAPCVADATSEGCLTCMAEHCTQGFCDCAGSSLSESCE